MSNKNLHKITFDDVVILPSRARTIPFAAIPRSNQGSMHSLDGLDWARGGRWNSEPMLSKEDGVTVGPNHDNGVSCASILNRNSAQAYGLDPSLYVEGVEEPHEEETYFDDDSIGRVWMSLEYNPESERLHLVLIKIKNLPSRTRSSANACDPVVRICLLPDERRWLQSKAKARSCNPRFEESFAFYVSQKDFSERTLKLTVYDMDRHKTLNKIGHVLYPLKGHQFEPNECIVVWRDIEKEVKQASLEKSQLYVSLSFNDVDRLSVGIFSGRNFSVVAREQPEASSPDFYIKVVLLKQNKKVKSKKTAVVRHSTSPNFNEMFHFTFARDDLSVSSVAISVLQAVRLHKDEVVGRLTIGSFMFARGPELAHWNEMISNPKQQASRWHDLVSAINTN